MVGIRHPELSEWKAFSGRIPDAAGAKTWRTFAQEAGLVEVSTNGEQVVVNPWGRRSDDRQIWFEGLASGSVAVIAMPRQVGDAVIAAMELGLADNV